jgi:predicted nucleic acid-binding protein
METDDLFLSAMTIGEIQTGVERERGRNPIKAQEIERWVDKIVGTYQIVPINTPIIRLWAKLMHRRSVKDYEDMMIAATAIIYDMTMVTRKIKDFTNLGVPLFNPFEFGKPT